MKQLHDTRYVYTMQEVCNALAIPVDKVSEIKMTQDTLIVFLVTEEFP